MEIKAEVPGLFGITDEHENLFNSPDCEGGPNSTPLATVFVMQDSSNVWRVEVIKVTRSEDLQKISFFLREDDSSTYVGGNGFGEVAMQMINGEPVGIDVTYAGGGDELQDRRSTINGDDGSTYPVHFSDNDRDGMLSAGDQFRVFGDPGPVRDDWKLDLIYDPTDGIVASANLV